MGDQVHCGHHRDHVAVDLLSPDLRAVNPQEDSIGALCSGMTATPRCATREGWSARGLDNFAVGAWAGEAPPLLILQHHLLPNFLVAQTASSENRADLQVEEEKVEEGENAGEEHPGPVVVEEDVA